MNGFVKLGAVSKLSTFFLIQPCIALLVQFAALLQLNTVQRPSKCGFLRLCCSRSEIPKLSVKDAISSYFIYSHNFQIRKNRYIYIKNLKLGQCFVLYINTYTLFYVILKLQSMLRFTLKLTKSVLCSTFKNSLIIHEQITQSQQ